jgi:hypothetical protein
VASRLDLDFEDIIEEGAFDFGLFIVGKGDTSEIGRLA